MLNSSVSPLQDDPGLLLPRVVVVDEELGVRQLTVIHGPHVVVPEVAMDLRVGLCFDHGGDVLPPSVLESSYCFNERPMLLVGPLRELGMRLRFYLIN